MFLKCSFIPSHLHILYNALAEVIIDNPEWDRHAELLRGVSDFMKTKPLRDESKTYDGAEDFLGLSRILDHTC